MHYITVKVKNKLASVDDGEKQIVCGNSDYVVRFELDSDWNGYALKTARFICESGEYYDIQFEGTECALPVLEDTRYVFVGLYAGDIRTSTAAKILCKASITDHGGAPAAPESNIYDQLMERMNALETPDAVLYDTEQALTETQKSCARSNIDIEFADDSEISTMAREVFLGV